MSNIDKRALRDSAESTIGILENIAGFEPSDIDGDTVELRFETEGGFDTGCDVSIVDQCQKAADVVRALLDELEAAEKRIAELEALGRGVKQFSEFQICHYGATEDYAKGYIDCQNNYNKVLFAAAGKGE
ncbi:ead/Ea22-like family protein [Enterobacter roggenkampii]|uniref:ead/Ea22-like family protein n=1 Tax=Enterobacter roggenkampii TaxID=1812935 RepID=UPI00240D150A|nr:ead/Ea22-like family protein [Enterobacter roggenkampii]WFC79978.1 ead/Ea22-like family protein [Enterobacter roggenkampii]